MKSIRVIKDMQIFEAIRVDKLLVKAGVFLGSLLIIANAGAAQPSTVPLFLSNPVTPMVMFNISKEHQLYLKAYDDYSDLMDSNGVPKGESGNLNGDGIPDRTYNPKYAYFGYFDVYKCYKYKPDSVKVGDGRYEPVDMATSDHYCNDKAGRVGGGEWSGNFLNWATMTRLDVIRKILYGGKRSLDTASDTTLERAFISSDAHAFAKFYPGNGADIKSLTPFDIPDNSDVTSTGQMANGITICNVSYPMPGATTANNEGSTKYSQDANYFPLIRVARGNFTFWASNERWQCNWAEEHSTTLNSAQGSNGVSYNVKGTEIYPAGIAAYKDNPSLDVAKKQKQLESGVKYDYVAKVQPCVRIGGKLSEDEDPSSKSSTNSKDYGDCFGYPNATKPVGLLQEFGDGNLIKFGLITGSYQKNKSGGVLRKQVSATSDEVSATDGTFTSTLAKNGIVAVLDSLRVSGYDYKSDQGLYTNGSNCNYGLNSFTDGNCSNWGNPQGEIFLESLRYLTNAGSAAYSADDSKYIYDPANKATQTLHEATWNKPLNTDNYCSSLNVIQFNNAYSSYDADTDAQYSKVTDLGMTGMSDVNKYTDEISKYDKVDGNTWFFGSLIGGSGTNINGLCTAKTLSSLSKASGTCTDAPRLSGGYAIAGLAYYARSVGVDVDAGLSKKVNKKVNTYGVALAPSVPKIEISLPSDISKKVTIQPACKNSSIPGNCAIVDFKVLSLTTNNTLPSNWPNSTRSANSAIGSDKATYGTLYVNWEDSEQGGDYDQDMWGLLDFAVSDSKVWIKTNVIAQSTGNAMAFGYILTGTDSDGFKAHAGINNFADSATYCSGGKCDCRSGFGTCDAGNIDTSDRAQTYNTGNSGAQSLKNPLYYAAQWGGYSDAFEKAVADNLAKTGKDLKTSLAERNPSQDINGDNYFYSTAPRELKRDLHSTLESIASKLASASAVATDSTRLSAGTYLYQAQFNSSDWTGRIYAYKFDASGNLVMDTSVTPNVPLVVQKSDMSASDGKRTVYVGLGANKWTQLSAGTVDSKVLSLFTPSYTLKTKTPTTDTIKWFLGDSSVEGAATGLRGRDVTSDGVRNTLGDIVNSSPVLSSSDDDYHFTDLPSVGASYATYLVDKKKQNQNIMIVGANDGMLHVFNADKSKSTITEIFSYMPFSQFPLVLDIARDNYGKYGNKHQFNVDGPLTVGDVYINGGWKTVVVGTLGAGGKAVFGLDITDATKPSLLFEISNLTAGFTDLGYVLGRPLIVPLQNGRWVAVFGNGEQAPSKANSKLMVVDLEDAANKSVVLDTGGGNGLSAPAIMINASRQATYAYAGDLAGNVWHFDLNPSSMKADYLLFTAKDSGGNPQPITAAPTVGINFSKDEDPMVYVGTGKYYDDSDVKAGTIKHSFYAVADISKSSSSPSLSTPVVDLKTLVNKTSSMTTDTSKTPASRIVSDASVTIDWKTKNGWRLDFGADGEEITTKAILIQDKLIFPTLIPSQVACEFGGKSWLMSLMAVGDKFTTNSVLPENKYNSFLVLGDLGVGINGESGRVIGSGSDSTIINEKITLDKSVYGRQSWRQIK